jgi:hypothetical protein
VHLFGVVPIFGLESYVVSLDQWCDVLKLSISEVGASLHFAYFRQPVEQPRSIFDLGDGVSSVACTYSSVGTVNSSSSSYSSSLLSNPVSLSSLIQAIWVANSDLEGAWLGGPSALAAVIIARSSSSSDSSGESSASSVVAATTGSQWF